MAIPLIKPARRYYLHRQIKMKHPEINIQPRERTIFCVEQKSEEVRSNKYVAFLLQLGYNLQLTIV